MEIVVARADSTTPCRVVDALDAGGHQTRQVETGTDAFKTLLFTGADALILNGSLPDVCQFDLCSGLRTIAYPGIIMLITDVADLDSRLRAFDSGADSYLVAPAEPVEILARLEAFDRLIQNQSQQSIRPYCCVRKRARTASSARIHSGALLF